jgi:hypothetical protein
VKELERIHSKDWGKLPNLPSNTVLFFLPDGMYASKETSDWMSKMNLRVAASDAVMETEKRVDVNTVVKNAGKICKVAGKIIQAEAESKRLQGLLEKKLEANAAVLARKQELASRAKRVAQLRDMCEREAMALDQERKKVHQLRRDLIPRSRILLEQSTKLVRQKQLLAVGKQNLKSTIRPALSDQKRLLDIRRQQLLRQFMKMYPLAEHKSAKGIPFLTVRQYGIPAPKFLIHMPEDDIAIALGFACHMVLYISKLLQVPLRYRIVYRGSRSAIADEVTDTTFPLFKGEDNLEHGYLLLNRDVEQMLTARLEDFSRQGGRVGILEGLEILLQHEVPQQKDTISASSSSPSSASSSSSAATAAGGAGGTS